MAYPVYHSPETSVENAKGVAKRRRAALACTSCRRRKIRCDAAQPACGHCQKTGLQCIYDESKRRRVHRDSRDQDGSADMSTSHRLKRVESMLAALMEKQGIVLKDGGEDYADRYSDSSSDSDSDSENDSPAAESRDQGQTDKGDEKLEASKLEASKPEAGKSEAFDISELRGVSRDQEKQSADMATASSIYSHGVTTTVLNPTCIRWLCTRVGNPELGREAEALLSWLWRQKALCEAPVRVPNGPGLDMDIVRYCIDQYRKCSCAPLKGLLNNEDVDAAIIACNGDLKSDKINIDSPYALVFSTVVMLVTNEVRVHKELGPYSAKQAVEQNRLAFLHGTRIASSMFMSHPTILLLRLLVSFTYMMAYRAMLSQLRTLGSLALTMASTLGLQREETSQHLPAEARKRRKILWLATKNIDIMLSLILFQQPLMKPNFSMSLTPAEWESDEGSWPAQQREYLSRIYMKAYQRVFSVEARNSSSHRLLRYILKYDSKLIQWEKALPEKLKDPVAVVENIVKLYNSADENGRKLEPYELLDKSHEQMNMVYTFICYYHILILLHTVPALTPSSLDAYHEKEGCLPERLLNSMEIISDSARKLLALLIHGRGAITEAVSVFLASNAFCVLFLKQIRQPRHPTNSADVLLFYQFIALFRERTSEPNSMASGDMSRNVTTAWLILARALTELNRKYQPALPTGVKTEIQEAEEKALRGFEFPFPPEMMHSKPKAIKQSLEAVEPQITMNGAQQASSQSLNIFTRVAQHSQQPQSGYPPGPLPGSLPQEQVNQTGGSYLTQPSRQPGAYLDFQQRYEQPARPTQHIQMGQQPQVGPLTHPVQSAQSAAPVSQPQFPPMTTTQPPAPIGYSPYPPQQPLAQLPLPTPQHTPPQIPNGQSFPIAQSLAPSPSMETHSDLSSDSPRVRLPSVSNMASQTQKAEGTEIGHGTVLAETPGASSSRSHDATWEPQMRPMFQAQDDGSYSFPGDESSLWDAFNGMRNRQSNVYEQALQSFPVEYGNNDITDDCIIA